MIKFEKLGEILRDKRKSKGLTYAVLSKKLDIDPSMLFNYEKSAFYPRKDVLKRICSFLKRPIGEMESLIESEKQNEVMAHAKYPDLRNIFIKAYNAEYAKWVKGAILSEKKLQYEFRKNEIHPIEQKLINETDKRLHAKNRIKSNESIVMNKFSSKEKESLFKEVITNWGFNPVHRLLMIDFQSQKGHFDTVRYKMTYSWEPG